MYYYRARAVKVGSSSYDEILKIIFQIHSIYINYVEYFHKYQKYIFYHLKIQYYF